MPRELELALNADDRASRIWQVITAGKKRGFAHRVASAKRPSTRETEAKRFSRRCMSVRTGDLDGVRRASIDLWRTSPSRWDEQPGTHDGKPEQRVAKGKNPRLGGEEKRVVQQLGDESARIGGLST